MRIIAEQCDVSFLPRPNRVRMVISDVAPSNSLVTSGLGLVFSDAGLLLTNLRQRGWDIPGGHLEPGESPVAAMQREVREETGVCVRPISLLGYQWVHVAGQVPDGYRYPTPDSYQLLFLAEPTDQHAFVASAETSGARFWALHEVVALPWVEKNRSLFDEAVKHWRRHRDGSRGET